MGIPKYFKYIVSNYDELTINPSELNNTINQITHFYLDMNCLIHPCVRKICNEHPNYMADHLNKLNTDEYNNNPEFITNFEKTIYNEINTYLDNLFNIVKPTNTIYLAVDGVAPRSKMEQQRTRRYRSIKEKSFIKDIYSKHAKHYEPEFDTNAITPGTIFLYKLCNSLREYIDSRYLKYEGISFILDDCQNVGEGEHKIFQHIKTINNENNVCVYGLDADLIMLSLCSPNNVYLLREKMHFNINSKSTDANDSKFLFLNIQLFKNQIYQKLDLMINANNTGDKINVEINNIILDYITLCFLIGNDFIPPLLGFDISIDSIEYLLNAYILVFKQKNDYLVNNGKINFIFIKQLFAYLYSNQDIILEKYNLFIENRKPWLKFNNNFELDIEKNKYYPYYNSKINIDLVSPNWIDKYYQYYLDINNIHKNKSYINEICKTYIEGLQWNLDYYINECPSYSWYYPYRAAPCLRDLCQYLIKRVYPAQFDKVTTYSPFAQLAIVLPIQSSNLWAKNYKSLTTNDINLKVNYPVDFELDTFNKLYLHECNPILPVINDSYILNIFKNLELTEFETNRNKISGLYIQKK